MTQTRDLIKKMADFFTGEEFYEKGEDARLELSPDDVRCMNEIIKACGNAISRQAVLNEFYDLENLYERIKQLPSVNSQKSCDTCKHSDETDGSHCYECVKGMKDNYDSQEPKYCDRNICIKNEYNGISCNECEVTKSQEKSGDLIQRQAVLDIIHRFFTEEVDKIPTKKTEDGEVLIMCKAQPLFEMNKAICKRIKALPSVSPTQNCVGNALDALDCISRQKVLDVINLNWYYRKNCIEAIENLPPVNPQEPKTGRWIQVENDKCKCDQCEVICFIGMYPFGHKNYCPNCGAKMFEPKESEVVNGEL